MWDRKELKAKGKAAYKANAVTCILAALLLMIAGGVGGTSGSVYSNIITNNINSGDTYESYDDSYYEDSEDDADVIIDDDSDGNIEIDLDGAPETEDIDISIGDTELLPLIGTIALALVLVGCLVAILLSVLVLNPLNVGLRKFFIDNSSDSSTGLNRDTIGTGFGGNYKNIVGAMFTTNLFIFLWSLLLVIPGIVKNLSWRLVPFILAENPGISGEEARDMSARMMYGSKWDSFVLDLSFLGWELLGALTLGILNIVFTNPYKAATDAELYLALKGGPESNEVNIDVETID